MSSLFELEAWQPADIPRPSLLQHFERNLEAQGSSIDEFHMYVERTCNQQQHEISLGPGSLVIDLRKMREAIVQRQMEDRDGFGVTLLSRAGHNIDTSEVVALIRGATTSSSRIGPEELGLSIRAANSYIRRSNEIIM